MSFQLSCTVYNNTIKLQLLNQSIHSIYYALAEFISIVQELSQTFYIGKKDHHK